MEKQSLPQPCYYIALSYCWGDPKARKKTTMKTLEHHQIGIPNEDLQPLHREAVALVRGLNINYLWIDSLCIIQDSAEDREEEIMQMSNIFAGALIVVVAASAKSPSDSLLRVKPPSDQSHTWRDASLIRYKEMDLNVKFRKRDLKAHLQSDATYLTHTGARAWCFQEKRLASRCLVFRDDEVVWECRSCCQCECGGEQEHLSVGYKLGFTMRPYQQRLLRRAKQDPFQVDGALTAFSQLPFAEHEPFQLDGTLAAFAQLPFAKHEPFQLDGTLKYFANDTAAYSFWEDAVSDYSHRTLSFETDRLPAISAAASIVAKATGDRYLAGLWRDKLVAGLSWILRPSSGSGLYQEYIAPTWSWASIPAGVFYFPSRAGPGSYRTRCDADLDASVLDAWTTLGGGNPYGPVSDAAIVLSGRHCDAELTIPERGFDAQLNFGHAGVQAVGLGPYFNALDFMRVAPDDNVDGLGGYSRYLRRVSPDRQANRQAPCSGTVHLLWLKEWICLILTPSRRKKGASGETAYERLGILLELGLGRLGHLGEDISLGIINSPKMPKTVQRSRITLV